MIREKEQALIEEQIDVSTDNKVTKKTGINNEAKSHTKENGVNNKAELDYKENGVNKAESDFKENSTKKIAKKRIYIYHTITENMTISEIARKSVPHGWGSVFEYALPELDEVSEFIVADEAKHGGCFPLKKNIFRAFELCPLKEVKVVILGQDPYPQLNKQGLPVAQGLCFSVAAGEPIQPSLRNIFSELKNEYPNFVVPKSGDLSAWASQGVLLLNSCLTFQRGSNAADKKHGKIWCSFLSKIIAAIAEKRPKAIYILWGKPAQETYSSFKDVRSDCSPVLESAHPSPMSANKGFFGNNHFRKINRILEKQGEKQIVWDLI